MDSIEELQMIKVSMKAQAIYDANKGCMTVEECASFLGVHHNTVKNRIHSGNIIANPIGTKWSIPKIQFLDKIIKEWENKKSHLGKMA